MTVYPLVSVVIPTYNRANDLRRALESVCLQTYTHWEVLIVDNSSSDNTDDVVNDLCDSRMRLFKIDNKGIIAASRNMGIRYAIGEYVAFLDSDDWWMPDKLACSIYCLEQGADIVYHDLLSVRKHDQRLYWKKVRTRELKSPVFADLLLNGNALNNSSVVVRRNVLNDVCGLAEDPSFVAAEDYELWLRIAQKTERFSRIPKALGYYWAGGGNVTNPVRELTYLCAIEDRYSGVLCGQKKKVGFFWMDYAKGRASFCIRDFERARRNLWKLSWKSAPFITFIKSRVMILLTHFYECTKGTLVK